MNIREQGLKRATITTVGLVVAAGAGTAIVATGLAHASTTTTATTTGGSSGTTSSGDSNSDNSNSSGSGSTRLSNTDGGANATSGGS